MLKHHCLIPEAATFCLGAGVCRVHDIWVIKTLRVAHRDRDRLAEILRVMSRFGWASCRSVSGWDRPTRIATPRPILHSTARHDHIPFLIDAMKQTGSPIL